MVYSNYPHGFTHGVTLRDIPVETVLSTRSNVFHVNSTIGSNGNTGTFVAPFATIAYAITQCTADHSDVIYVSAAHTETVIAAGGLTVNVDGVTIVFQGDGDANATVKFNTDVAASMLLSGNNITIKGGRFLADIDALTGPISITGTDNKIIDCEWYDAAAKATTDCIVIANTAHRTIISGWKYHVSTTGTQKQSNIQYNATTGLTLANIDITGDFATGNIENVSAAATDVRFENIKLKNANAGPQPGMVIQANTTGLAKNVDIRIASGTTYVSNVAKLNWDNNCLGYNADGTTGDPIGTGPATSVEGKIDLIQADIGNPSARTNFQSLEAMLGIPDAANSCIDDILRTGFDSSAITPSATGSILERLEQKRHESGLMYYGVCDTGMVGSTTTIVSAHLIGYGDDAFNAKYYMQIIRNTNSVGAAPETQIRQITDYVSATGTFTTNAFGANVEEGDIIIVMHEGLVSGTTPIGTMVNTINTSIGDPSGHTLTSLTAKIGDNATTLYAELTKLDSASLAVAPTAGSVGSFIASGGTALGTQLGDSKSIIDALGSNGTTLVYGSGSMLGAIGTTFIVKKTVTSSDIPVTPAVYDITGVSSGGELMIEDIVLKTDGTGLATGTNFQLLSDNAKGAPLIMVETVANLGVSKTVELDFASISHVRNVLETGKKLQVNSTALACTGAGTIDIYVKFRRVAAGAIVAAA